MRFWQLVVCFALALFFAVALPSAIFAHTALVLGILGVLIVAYRFLSLNTISGSQELSDSVVPYGTTLTHRVTMTNRSLFPVTLQVMPVTTMPDVGLGFIGAVGSGDVTKNSHIMCTRRGRFVFERVATTAYGLLGMLSRHQSIGQSSSVLVLPRVVPLSTLAFTLGGAQSGETHGHLRGEEPPTVTTLRDYNPGDSVSAIDARASARQGKLMVRQFEVPIKPTVWLVVDLPTGTSNAAEEVLVTAAASILRYLNSATRVRIGFLLFGDTLGVVTDQIRQRSIMHMQELLAEVHATASASMDVLLRAMSQHVAPRQTAIILTGRSPDAWYGWLERAQYLEIAVRVVHVGSPSTWTAPSIGLSESFADPAHAIALVQALEGR